jgi:iron(III) transport system permease protein
VLTLLLAVLVAAPLLKILWATVAEDGAAVWSQVVWSRLSPNLLYEPLGNTLALGVLTALGTTLIGGFLAWLVVLTDVPFRRTLGALAALPFMIPSFAAAFAWGVVFRNDRVGGQIGLLQELGLAVPDWLAWGFVPTLLVLVAHYYALAFLLIAAALASINADLVEAGSMSGAGRWRVLTGITLPVVLPSIVAGISLTFAGAVSNFAAPALLGLPAGMHTLSTRLYGMISTGQVERGYALALLLILVAAGALWFSNRVVHGRRSYATITGKGGRRRRFALHAWRWPLFAVAVLVILLTTVAPAVALLLSSLAKQTGALTSGFTLHYWIGASDPAFAQGQAGVLRNPQFLSAAGTTLLLGAAVALAATLLGLAIAYVVTRRPGTLLGGAISQLAFLPVLIPGIAFGAAYIALFGSPLGPLPALYGTFTLLVLAGTVYTLPFAVQSGRAAMTQVAGDLEDSARMTGAGFGRRLMAIFVPLTLRGLVAGAVLVFVKMVRDLSLVVLLFTPTTPILSVVAYRYASEGFLQFANAITVVITLLSLLATLIAQRLQGASQPWTKDG